MPTANLRTWQVASVKHNFVCVDMDAVIAQCLSMGFPVEATLEAHKQLGNSNSFI